MRKGYGAYLTTKESKRPTWRARARGYSLLEMLITVFIIQIISVCAVMSISHVEAGERTERAANEVVVALRYARMLAMSTGQSAGVEFDGDNQRIRVFQGPSCMTAANSQMPSGVYIINLTTQQDVKGVRVATAALGSDAAATNLASPYRVVFGNMGGTGNSGSVTLQYAKASTRVVNISAVGEAK
jgi:Tfp pilus assembly protein FimT